ncbi:MAG: TRAP transporter substrate-binding protein [Caulobacterales bacterium]
MTTRRNVIRSGASAAGLLGLSGCVQAATGVLTAADVHRSTYPTVVAVQWIGEQLAKETQGRLSIQTFPAGQVGSEDDSIGLARMGALDMVRVSSAALNNRVPLTRLLGLPYVIRSREQFRAVADGAVGARVSAAFQGTGLVPLAIYDAGLRCVYNTKRPIETPRDLLGLKLRTPQSDLFIGIVRAMGASPTPLTIGYVFQGLSTHLIDGAENNWPTFESSRHVELAKHWSNTLHSAAPEFLLMSQRRFEALSAADRALIRDVAARSKPVMRAAWDRLETESEAAARAEGAIVTEPDRSAFEAATKRLVAEEIDRLNARDLVNAIARLDG